jgi:hypothetical protein
VAAPLRFGE